jgi:hypothetical protein
MKRRVYAAVFNIDKVLATFTGRPPLLNRLHSSTKIPLDLGDETILAARIQESPAKLDANGWNHDGQIHSTTILRARTMFAKIRDEILEITSNSGSESIVDRALYVVCRRMVSSALTMLQRLENQTIIVHAHLPAFITYVARDTEKPDAPGDVLYARILTRLEFLLNRFLFGEALS